jgi:L-phenylalanine/L-methionine N-acetyltransferase
MSALMNNRRVRRSPAAATQVTIRPVRLEDVEAINLLRRQPSVADYTAAFPSERIESNREFVEALSPDDHLMVAELDGQVVGMAGLHVKSGKQRHSAVLGIMVHDQLQDRGIGRRLMESLLDLADNWIGLVRVELEVYADNARAIHLYETLGFEHEGRRIKGVFRNGQYADVLIMGRVR